MSVFKVIGEVSEDKSIDELLEAIADLAHDSRGDVTKIASNMDSIMHLAADVRTTIEIQIKK